MVGVTGSIEEKTAKHLKLVPMVYTWIHPIRPKSVGDCSSSQDAILCSFACFPDFLWCFAALARKAKLQQNTKKTVLKGDTSCLHQGWMLAYSSLIAILTWKNNSISQVNGQWFGLDILTSQPHLACLSPHWWQIDCKHGDKKYQNYNSETCQPESFK